MSAVRRVLFWVLLLAVPFQALAGAGLLCANPLHHTAPAQHVHVTLTASADGAHADVGHSHAVAHVADVADTSDADSTAPPFSGLDKCSACSGCCSSALAITPVVASSAVDATAYEVATYVAPVLAIRAGDGPFRPPRTLTH